MKKTDAIREVLAGKIDQKTSLEIEKILKRIEKGETVKTIVKKSAPEAIRTMLEVLAEYFDGLF